jgi:hypothetical protein
MVAHADPTIAAPVAEKGEARAFGGHRAVLPALGLGIVDMDVGALADISDDPTDVLAVFDGAIAGIVVPERDLWPIGTSERTTRLKLESSAVTTQSISVPPSSPRQPPRPRCLCDRAPKMRKALPHLDVLYKI